MKRLLVILLVAGLLFTIIPLIQGQTDADILVYGGGFSGSAAARSAAASAPKHKVLLVVPEPVNALGGLGTVGGQNCADIRLWKNQLVTQGSFGRWFKEAGQFYNTEKMAEIIEKDLKNFPNIEIVYSQDIKEVRSKKDIIKEVILQPIQRNQEGRVVWHGNTKSISAKVFIDASDDGRLARLTGAP